MSESQYKVYSNKLGTPKYLAPEVLDSKGYALPVDICALGIILFVLGTFFSANVFGKGDVKRGEAKYKVCADVD